MLAAAIIRRRHFLMTGKRRKYVAPRRCLAAASGLGEDFSRDDKGPERVRTFKRQYGSIYIYGRRYLPSFAMRWARRDTLRLALFL